MKPPHLASNASRVLNLRFDIDDYLISITGLTLRRFNSRDGAIWLENKTATCPASISLLYISSALSLPWNFENSLVLNKRIKCNLPQFKERERETILYCRYITFLLIRSTNQKSGIVTNVIVESAPLLGRDKITSRTNESRARANLTRNRQLGITARPASRHFSHGEMSPRHTSRS